jgi:outer membrane protein assembly factor BamE (lipoprotein component of BamABCDE complex)
MLRVFSPAGFHINNHSSDRKYMLKLLAYFVFSALFFSISFLKKGQYFHISFNLGFVLEQISLISLKSKKFKDEIF